jgi:Zn-dependent peptidase ImmA (M78 family)
MKHQQQYQVITEVIIVRTVLLKLITTKQYKRENKQQNDKQNDRSQ